jgi:hypothetical protein
MHLHEFAIYFVQAAVKIALHIIVRRMIIASLCRCQACVQGKQRPLTLRRRA